MKFYKTILKEVDNPIIEAYGKNSGITFEQRLEDGECPECNGDRWYFLPKESVAVKEGGKPYIECLGCGYLTHL